MLITDVIEGIRDSYKKRKNPYLLCVLIVWCSMNVRLLTAIFSIHDEMKWYDVYLVIQNYANDAHYFWFQGSISWRWSIIISVLTAFPYMFLQNIILASAKALYNWAASISERLRMWKSGLKWVEKDKLDTLQREYNLVIVENDSLVSDNSGQKLKLKEFEQSFTNNNLELVRLNERLTISHEEKGRLNLRILDLESELKDCKSINDTAFDWRKNKWFEGEWDVTVSRSDTVIQRKGIVLDCGHDFLTLQFIGTEPIRYPIIINTFNSNKVWFTKQTPNLPQVWSCHLTRVSSSYFVGFEFSKGEIYTMEYRKIKKPQ